MTDAIPTDESLLARAAHGDRMAFDTLAGRYLLRLRRAAMRVLNDPAAAEDVAQETLLRAWTRAASYRPGQAAVGTWLHRIAVNAASTASAPSAPAPNCPRTFRTWPPAPSWPSPAASATPCWRRPSPPCRSGSAPPSP